MNGLDEGIARFPIFGSLWHCGAVSEFRATPCPEHDDHARLPQGA